MAAATLRPAEPRDHPALAELLAQLGYPADPAALPDRLARLERTPGAELVVAEVAGRTVGLATLHLLPVIHEDAPRGQLTSLVVLETHRGRGLGRLLVEHLERRARAAGVRRMAVTTANHRSDTHRFYEGLGYVWTGRRYGKELPPESAA